MCIPAIAISEVMAGEQSVVFVTLSDTEEEGGEGRAKTVVTKKALFFPRSLSPLPSLSPALCLCSFVYRHVQETLSLSVVRR